MSEPRYHYRVYGLILESQIPFPDLPETSESHADVLILKGSVSEHLENPRDTGYKYEASRNQVLINTYSVAKILVSDGKTMIVEPRKGALDIEIRLLLFGWGMGALLHQRKFLPLHAGVISTGDECVVFCAQSGTGKSTLLSAFLKKGYQLIDDNIAAIRMNNGSAFVWPGYPEIKLMNDALTHLKDEPFPVRGQVLRRSLKFAVNVSSQFYDSPSPVKKIYVIKRDDSILKVNQLKGGTLFHSLAENTFCLQYAKGMGIVAENFNLIRCLAECAPVCEVRYSTQFVSPDNLAEALEKDFRA